MLSRTRKMSSASGASLGPSAAASQIAASTTSIRFA